jgi:hypothetical protein
VVVPTADLFTDTVVVNTALQHRRRESDVGIGLPASRQMADAIRHMSGYEPPGAKGE